MWGDIERVLICSVFMLKPLRVNNAFDYDKFAFPLSTLIKFSDFVPLNRFKCRPNKFLHDLTLGGHFIIPVGGPLSGYFGVT